MLPTGVRGGKDVTISEENKRINVSVTSETEKFSLNNLNIAEGVIVDAYTKEDRTKSSLIKGNLTLDFGDNLFYLLIYEDENPNNNQKWILNVHRIPYTIENQIDSISVVDFPKLLYIDSYFPTEAKIKINYTNGTNSLSELKEEMTTGFDTSTSGVKYLRVEYQGITVSYQYEVYSLIELSVDSNFKYEYKIGDEFSPSELICTYSNGTKETIRITKDMVYGFNTETSGKKNLYITYKNLTIKEIIDVIVEVNEDTTPVVETAADKDLTKELYSTLYALNRAELNSDGYRILYQETYNNFENDSKALAFKDMLSKGALTNEEISKITSLIRERNISKIFKPLRDKDYDALREYTSSLQNFVKRFLSIVPKNKAASIIYNFDFTPFKESEDVIFTYLEGTVLKTILDKDYYAQIGLNQNDKNYKDHLFNYVHNNTTYAKVLYTVENLYTILDSLCSVSVEHIYKTLKLLKFDSFKDIFDYENEEMVELLHSFAYVLNELKVDTSNYRNYDNLILNVLYEMIPMSINDKLKEEAKLKSINLVCELSNEFADIFSSINLDDYRFIKENYLEGLEKLDDENLAIYVVKMSKIFNPILKAAMNNKLVKDEIIDIVTLNTNINPDTTNMLINKCYTYASYNVNQTVINEISTTFKDAFVGRLTIYNDLVIHKNATKEEIVNDINDTLYTEYVKNGKKEKVTLTTDNIINAVTNELGTTVISIKYKDAFLYYNVLIIDNPEYEYVGYKNNNPFDEELIYAATLNDESYQVKNKKDNTFTPIENALSKSSFIYLVDGNFISLPATEFVLHPQYTTKGLQNGYVEISNRFDTHNVYAQFYFFDLQNPQYEFEYHVFDTIKGEEPKFYVTITLDGGRDVVNYDFTKENNDQVELVGLDINTVGTYGDCYFRYTDHLDYQHITRAISSTVKVLEEASTSIYFDSKYDGALEYDDILIKESNVTKLDISHIAKVTVLSTTATLTDYTLDEFNGAYQNKYGISPRYEIYLDNYRSFTGETAKFKVVADVKIDGEVVKHLVGNEVTVISDAHYYDLSSNSEIEVELNQDVESIEVNKFNEVTEKLLSQKIKSIKITYKYGNTDTVTSNIYNYLSTNLKLTKSYKTVEYGRNYSLTMSSNNVSKELLKIFVITKSEANRVHNFDVTNTYGKVFNSINDITLQKLFEGSKIIITYYNRNETYTYDEYIKKFTGGIRIDRKMSEYTEVSFVDLGYGASISYILTSSITKFNMNLDKYSFDYNDVGNIEELIKNSISYIYYEASNYGSYSLNREDGSFNNIISKIKLKSNQTFVKGSNNIYFTLGTVETSVYINLVDLEEILNSYIYVEQNSYYYVKSGDEFTLDDIIGNFRFYAMSNGNSYYFTKEQLKEFFGNKTFRYEVSETGQYYYFNFNFKKTSYNVSIKKENVISYEEGLEVTYVGLDMRGISEANFTQTNNVFFITPYNFDSYVFNLSKLTIINYYLNYKGGRYYEDKLTDCIRVSYETYYYDFSANKSKFRLVETSSNSYHLYYGDFETSYVFNIVNNNTEVLMDYNIMFKTYYVNTDIVDLDDPNYLKTIISEISYRKEKPTSYSYNYTKLSTESDIYNFLKEAAISHVINENEIILTFKIEELTRTYYFTYEDYKVREIWISYNTASPSYFLYDEMADINIDNITKFIPSLRVKYKSLQENYSAKADIKSILSQADFSITTDTGMVMAVFKYEYATLSLSAYKNGGISSMYVNFNNDRLSSADDVKVKENLVSNIYSINTTSVDSSGMKHETITDKDKILEFINDCEISYLDEPLRYVVFKKDAAESKTHYFLPGDITSMSFSFIDYYNLYDDTYDYDIDFFKQFITYINYNSYNGDYKYLSSREQIGDFLDEIDLTITKENQYIYFKAYYKNCEFARQFTMSGGKYLHISWNGSLVLNRNEEITSDKLINRVDSVYYQTSGETILTRDKTEIKAFLDKCNLTIQITDNDRYLNIEYGGSMNSHEFKYSDDVTNIYINLNYSYIKSKMTMNNDLLSNLISSVNVNYAGGNSVNYTTKKDIKDFLDSATIDYSDMNTTYYAYIRYKTATTSFYIYIDSTRSDEFRISVSSSYLPAGKEIDVDTLTSMTDNIWLYRTSEILRITDKEEIKEFYNLCSYEYSNGTITVTHTDSNLSYSFNVVTDENIRYIYINRYISEYPDVAVIEDEDFFLNTISNINVETNNTSASISGRENIKEFLDTLTIDKYTYSDCVTYTYSKGNASNSLTYFLNSSYTLNGLNINSYRDVIDDTNLNVGNISNRINSIHYYKNNKLIFIPYEEVKEFLSEAEFEVVEVDHIRKIRITCNNLVGYIEYIGNNDYRELSINMYYESFDPTNMTNEELAKYIRQIYCYDANYNSYYLRTYSEILNFLNESYREGNMIVSNNYKVYISYYNSGMYSSFNYQQIKTILLEEGDLDIDNLASQLYSIFYCDGTQVYRYDGDDIAKFLKTCNHIEEGTQLKLYKNGNYIGSIDFVYKDKVTYLYIQSTSYSSSYEVDDYNVTIDAEYIANHTSYVEYCLNGNYYYVYNHDMDSLRTFLSSVEIDTTYQQTENHYVVLKKDYGSCTIYLYI
ncbi:MAG: hypothetical protein IJU60_02450 [Acholeplasmatales bacterium]|nr:hypothetical protein [Acholeplasmatales bacterium]